MTETEWAVQELMPGEWELVRSARLEALSESPQAFLARRDHEEFWGEQECAADGQGFGPCRERHPPPRCDGIARRERASPELEQCCIDDGYCCLDQHDLDHDGNRGDMLGACDGVRCP